MTPRARRLAPLGLACALLACQARPETASTLTVTSSGTPRTLVLASQAPATPRPTATPTPEPTPPRDANPPLPPATPAPVPSAKPPGTTVGGPTPAPVATPTPSLALVPGPQPPDTWAAGPPMLRPRAGLAAGVVAGVLLAAEGGPRPSVETLALTGTGNVWRLIDRHDPHLATGGYLPLGISLVGSGVSGATLYTAGGSEAGVSGAVARYGNDGFLDRVATLPTPVMAPAAGMIGGTLVVAGGLAADGPSAAVQRVVVASAGLSEGATLGVPTAGAAAAVVGEKLWVMGGYGVSRLGELEPSKAVAVYDLAADKWRRSDDGQAAPPPDLPEARHSAAAAVVDGRIYLMGGVGAGGGLIASVLVHDPAVQPPAWKPVAGMPTPRALLAVSAAAGKVWAIGGRGADGRPSTAVEVYQP